jgi:hypothetical protein
MFATAPRAATGSAAAEKVDAEPQAGAEPLDEVAEAQASGAK